MTRYPNLRSDARAIFAAGLSAADPVKAVHRFVQRKANTLIVNDQQYDLGRINRIVVVGAGKASGTMAAALERILGDALDTGVVIVKYEHHAPTQRVELIEAGHPVPDENGVRGAERITELLGQLVGDDLVFCLISGGGSALLPAPVPGVSLTDKQVVTEQLLACGADIAQINTIRKHLSQLKGGQLARHAAPATVISLILSDVIGDQLDTIGSGPTAPDTTTFGDCLKIIDGFAIEAKLPATVMHHLRSESSETPKPGDSIFEQVQNVIIASNVLALEAARHAAEALGYKTTVLTSTLNGEARRLAQKHTRQIERASGKVCLIAGGEPTVTLRGSGKGGRAQEYALAAALTIDKCSDVAILAGGTDGTDGPTDAAGAIVDGNTITRARNLRLDAAASLADNDAYHFFEPLGDLLITGPSGTNVMDLYILLRQ